MSSLFDVLQNQATSLVASQVTAAASSALKGVVGSLGIPALPFGGLPTSTAGLGSGTSTADTPLSEFLVEIQTDGVAWSNKFFVNFTAPALVLDNIRNSSAKAPQAILDPQSLTMRCDMAEIPGYQYLTSDTRTMGPIYKTPNQIAYGDLNLSFIMSADFAELYFFNYWMMSIKDESDMFAYYKDIVTNIELRMYDTFNNPVYGTTFWNCWPIATNPMQVSWQEQDYLRLGVSFAYEKWTPLVYGFSEHSTNFSGSRINLGADVAATSSGLSSFTSLLPNLPGGAQIAAITTSSLLKTGTSLVGSVLKSTNPVTGAVISAGVSSLSQSLSGSFGGGGS
jgi:hypothetical protein